jgi:hypothetical protein
MLIIINREFWSIDKIIEFDEKVVQKELPEDSEHLRGCKKLPLFDLEPIENFIVPVHHFLIGVRNSLVNAVFEFVDECIEGLPEQLVVAHNNINTAEINLEDAEADYNDWLQNDGTTLSECLIEKSNIVQWLKGQNGEGSLLI